jgi:hypothetical protein
LGHFFRFAFCTATAAGSEAVEARVSYLNVGVGWSDMNLLQVFDQKIEGEICDHLRRSIPDSETLDRIAE